MKLRTHAGTIFVVVVSLILLGISIIIEKSPISLPFLSSRSILDSAPGPAPAPEFTPNPTSGPSPEAPSAPPPAGGTGSLPLTIPSGFKMQVFAKDLAGARVLRFDSDGNLWVSLMGKGVVAKLTLENGSLKEQKEVFTGLNKPHGLAFDPDDKKMLYIAEEGRVAKYDVTQPGKAGEKILDLPTGGNHVSRTIAFGPDKKLYITVGSSCNVCHEEDERRAAMLRYDPQTKQSEIYARGLRNTVFFVWDKAGRLFGTDMGRDLLGDNIPPDELNIIEQGGNYGWPICYGNNIHDDKFDKNTYIRNPCMVPFEKPSYVDFQAHSAPLGLAFAPESWPAEYRNDLFVSFHGSWNRSQATGYKVVRVMLDESGNSTGIKDFITGWLAPGLLREAALGRPVDIVTDNAGALYISDDKAGVIYRLIAL
ncbi:MAG: PQQ-dependent sugar dehydrogenase [bacterium]|nr:PQQ-dependent sugar dehydrogenase [bacterium]